MVTIKDLKYKVVKNFLTKEETELGVKYNIHRHRNNTTDFAPTQSNNRDTCYYGDPLTDALLYNKIDLMEKETNLELFPTYSYSRLYTYNAELKNHLDRPSCEISVTVMFGSCGTDWPIYMGDKPVLLEPGDACIYLGCELNHYRKTFTGDWHSQMFLHYVDKNGPNVEWKYDKTPPLFELG